ncbi:unnamed protein product [Spirodela intermedia]|uniref:Uncharacterized protein n=1 Tax=Spirodela intermedia TaxID=51605 RepID=A0A7I8K622_SPIIN|nr:unnamed protein product [Spirodela intermedia]
MKKLLKSRFLPPNYEQGSRSITEYTEEFYRLSLRVDLTKSKSYIIYRFKSGLQWDIEEKVTLQSFFKLNDVIMALKCVEALLDKEKFRTRNSTNVSTFQLNRSRPVHISSTINNRRSATLVAPRPSEYIPSGQNSFQRNPYVPNSIAKYYRCNEEGHKSNTCPKHGAVNFTKEEIQENVIESKEEEPFAHSLVIRRLMYAPKKEEPLQRHNVFITKCTIDEKVGDVIIDSDNSENIISSLMIKKNYETRVMEIYLVKFSIGKVYFDEIYCDVVEMDDCHLIFSRSWQYDLDATHLGRNNHYGFYKNSEKFVLCLIKENEFFNTIKEKKKQVMMIDKNELFNTLKENSEVFMLIKKDDNMLNEFFIIQYSSITFPPLRDIQHHIDLILGTSLSNLPHYRMSPKENNILQEQYESMLNTYIISSKKRWNLTNVYR